MIRRTEGTVEARKTAIGLMPKTEDINLTGLKLSRKDMDQLLMIDRKQWLKETGEIGKYLESLGPELPVEIRTEYSELLNRINKMS